MIESGDVRILPVIYFYSQDYNPGELPWFVNVIINVLTGNYTDFANLDCRRLVDARPRPKEAICRWAAKKALNQVCKLGGSKRIRLSTRVQNTGDSLAVGGLEKWY